MNRFSLAWTPERKPWRWPDALALGVWTAAVLLIFGEAATLQKALFYFDITEINFPYRDFLANEYRAGRFSRWMPGLYCGLPLFAESQAGYLHPLKLLYLALPTWQAFNLDTMVSVWLTGFGAYGWLRRHVGTSGALTGAAIFGMNGFVWAHVIHTSMINALASVPFAFWALERTWDGGRLRGCALGALAIAFQIFAGHLQDTILTGLALVLYGGYRCTLERTARGRWFVLGTAAGMVLLGGLIAAVQVLPSKDLIDRSPRARGLTWDDLTYGSWSPELLPMFVVREAYGTRARDTDWMDGFYPYQEMNTYLSFLGLGLAVAGAAAYRERWVAFWPLLCGLGLLMMLGRFNILFDIMPQIPIIGSGRIPVRYHLWVALGASALAAVGVDRLARPGAVRLRGVVLFWVLFCVVCLGILALAYMPLFTEAAWWTVPAYRERTHALEFELAVSSARSLGLALLGLWLASAAARSHAERLRRRVAGLLPLVVLADLIGAHWFEVPAIDPSYWTTPPGTAVRLRADPDLIRIFGMGRYSAGEPGYAVRPVDFFAARDTLAWSLAPVWGVRSSGRITPIVPSRMVRYDEAANAADVRFECESVTHLLAGTAGTMRRAHPPEQIGRAYIYKLDDPLPRARLLGRPVYVADERGAERAFAALGRAARERIIVEDPDEPLAPDAHASGSARIVRDEPEHLEIEAVAETPAYLFVADSFDPGWTATRDGQPVPIRPANIAFRAVFLPPGSHRVSFRYEPVGFRVGAWISAVGLVLVLACLAWPRPLAALEAEHGCSSWPRWWPIGALAIAAVWVAASVVAIDPEGRIGVQKRWDIAFHPFTWDAKIVAIGPPKREVD